MLVAWRLRHERWYLSASLTPDCTPTGTEAGRSICISQVAYGRMALSPFSRIVPAMHGTRRYDHLSREALIGLLERRDTQRSYGLVWEREGIDRERAINEDFVVLDLDPALSTAPQDTSGWRNLIIEGDNWDALRALRLAYAARVKCILIDPPYNTGNKDFVYNDSFVGKQDRYRQSVWLEFLYRRLLLARELLAEDGVILVCINDENRARLDLLMEQVFPGMRVGSFVWRTKDTANNTKERAFSGVHEHILVYAAKEFRFISEKSETEKIQLREGDNKPSRLDPITMAQDYINRENTYYPMQNPVTGLWYPCSPFRVWSIWSKQKPTKKKNAGPPIEQLISDGRIYFPAEKFAPLIYNTIQELIDAIEAGRGPVDGKRRPLLRLDLPDLASWVGRPIAHGRPSLKTFVEGEQLIERPVSSWIASAADEKTGDDFVEIVGERQGVGTDAIMSLFGDKVFTFPKPPNLISRLVSRVSSGNDIVLDFFAGSGTTGAAVLAANEDDDEDRRFILVSNTEATPDEPTKNLCRDVCAERIRRTLAGNSKKKPLPGDFAYLRTKRLAWDDVIYDLEPAAIWTLLLLRQDRPLTTFDPVAPVQVSRPAADQPEDSIMAYVPRPDDEAMIALRALAAEGALVVFTPVPGRVRDALAMPGVPIEIVPDRLLAEFPRIVAGL